VRDAYDIPYVRELPLLNLTTSKFNRERVNLRVPLNEAIIKLAKFSQDLQFT
jgi:hypothetical protein